MTAPDLHFLVPGPLEQRTGGYLYDARIVAGLGDRGWRVRVVNLPGSFPAADELARSAMGEALERIPDNGRVVIDGLAMGGLPGPVQAHAGRLRIVSLVHHPLAEETGLSEDDRKRFSESEREALGACTGVVVTSAFTAERLTDYGVPERLIRAVPPGTDRARLAEGPRLGEPPRLICVASVTPRKGCDVLVDALELVRDLSWTCVVAGSLDRDPEHARSVRARVASADLESRIDFVGEQDEESLDGLFHGASLFVLASHYEGYGMALAEALARGLPVLSTTGGAIPFTVPADAGVLVDPGDASAFAEALRSLLGEPPGRLDRLGAAARRHARELPTWDASVQAFATALRELAP